MDFYGTDFCDMLSGSVGCKYEEQEQILLTEIDCLRRSCGRTRLARMWKETVRETVEMEKDIIDEVHKRQLMWFGH